MHANKLVIIVFVSAFRIYFWFILAATLSSEQGNLAVCCWISQTLSCLFLPKVWPLYETLVWVCAETMFNQAPLINASGICITVKEAVKNSSQQTLRNNWALLEALHHTLLPRCENVTEMECSNWRPSSYSPVCDCWPAARLCTVTSQIELPYHPEGRQKVPAADGISPEDFISLLACHLLVCLPRWDMMKSFLALADRATPENSPDRISGLSF